MGLDAIDMDPCLAYTERTVRQYQHTNFGLSVFTKDTSTWSQFLPMIQGYPLLHHRYHLKS